MHVWKRIFWKKYNRLINSGLYCKTTHIQYLVIVFCFITSFASFFILTIFITKLRTYCRILFVSLKQQWIQNVISRIKRNKWLCRWIVRFVMTHILQYKLAHGMYLKWTPCRFVECQWVNTIIPTPTARFMEPRWGPSGADRTQVGPMLAPWTLLSG